MHISEPEVTACGGQFARVAICKRLGLGWGCFDRERRKLMPLLPIGIALLGEPGQQRTPSTKHKNQSFWSA